MLPENYSRSVFTVAVVAGKMSLLSFTVFKTAIADNDVMCHVTKYCNVIGPHCYSVAGQGLYMQFTRPFPCLRDYNDPRLSPFSSSRGGKGKGDFPGLPPTAVCPLLQ